MMIFDEKAKETFSRRIEEYVQINGDGYIEAIIALGDEYGIEPKVAAKFISKPIIEKVQKEGQEINLLPETSKLPI